MGIKDKFEELKSFISSDVEDDNVEPQGETQTVKESDKMINSRIVLMEPEDFSKTEEAAELIKSGHSVVLNLNMLNEKSAQRMIDYLGGVVYALDGTIESIGSRIILCAPSTTEVHGKIKNSADV